MDQQEASRLLDRYLNHQCTAEEQVLVEQWYEGLVQESGWELEGSRREEAGLELKQRIDRELGWAPRTRTRSIVWYAAAAVLVLIGVALFFTLRTPQQPASPPLAEITAGGNKATLTLASGQTISLDDAKDGNIAQQGQSAVSKTAGRVVYTPGSEETNILFNTLSTPKGGQYQLELPDGSKVWLNALSSIKFPTAFKGATRQVSIKGEVYFEIAKNASQPFHVTVNEMEVEVIGTHFNIAAYADEAFIRTTLLEGKVKVTGRDAVTISPGQQAVMSSGPGKQTVQVLNNVNTDQVTAWMNGYFQFSQSGIEDVMKQIARWYDIEVRYEGKMTSRKFSGEISRASNLSEVLKGLTITGINVRREGRTIVVMP